MINQGTTLLRLKCCACHEICTSSAGAQPTPGRTSDPWASSKRRTQHANAIGAQPTPGRTSDPFASSKRGTQHANATGRVPVPSRRQGVHPTPWQAAHGGSQSAVPATRSAHGGSQSTAPAKKSAHEGSRSAAPATKSAHEGSRSAAPATKSAHQAPVPSRRQGVHLAPLASSKRCTQCTWRLTKCCACHEICTRRFTKYCACHEICT